MVSINVDSLWSLMSQYTFKMDPECFDESLICVICKKLLVDACQSLCGCRYCFSCIKSYIEDGNKYCPGSDAKCSEEYLELDKDIVKDRRTNNKIYRLKVKCPNDFCLYYSELSRMSDHLRVCSKEVVSCPYGSIGCDKEITAKDEVLTHLCNESLTHSHLLIECIQMLKNEVDLLKGCAEVSKAEIISLKGELTVKDDKMNSMEQKLNTVLKEIEGRNFIGTQSVKGENMLESLQSNISTFNAYSSERSRISADFVWSITECSKNIGPNRYSDAFYSKDYKLCMCMFIYGDSVGLNCVIMRGEHDDKVVWPMMKAVTLAIINQDTMSTYKSLTLHHNTYNNKSAFYRPKNDRCNHIGVSPFILYSVIKDLPSVLVNDTLLVTCVLSDH